MADGPLRGVRVLDLTHVWAGPLAARILADLGAEVVRIEASHSRGPRVFPSPPAGGYIDGDRHGEPWNSNAIFVKLARNKRSVALDLKHPDGRATFLQLVAVADVVIENFSARAMPGLGLGYAELRAANPRLVYASMPGYGMDGPGHQRVAFGPTIEAVCGFDAVFGYSADELRNTAMALMDPIGGVQAAGAVVAALRRREQTGTGALVELSLHEGGVMLCGPWLVDRQYGQDVPVHGNRHPAMAPHGVYPAAADPGGGDDRWISLACRDDADWRALCAALGPAWPFRADLDLDGRRAAADAIDAALAAWTVARSRDAAVATLRAAGVPAGAVSDARDLLADPQLAARGFFVPLEAGPTVVPGNPVHMAGLSSADWTPAPRLGADNARVLRDWLGLDATAIDGLERAGVLADRPPA